MTVLTGPTDKGQFKDDPINWKMYLDPLPPCDIAPHPTEGVPGVSTVKRAWPKVLDNWIKNETFASAWKFREQLNTMSEAEAKALIVGASDRTRDTAADRGHAIHEALEHLMVGKPLPISLDGNLDVARYLPILEQLIEAEKPEIVASEVVVFGHGYGGTFDSVWRIDGKLYLVDYKTRKMGKAATRYPEEGAQLGAYGSALYWIIEDENGIRRMLPLELDGGLIVSVAPDGYRIYEVELGQAIEMWASLYTFHVAKENATKMFSRPRGSDLKSTDTAADDAIQPALTEAESCDVVVESGVGSPWPAERVVWLRQRLSELPREAAVMTSLKMLWPSGSPKPLEVKEGASMDWDKLLAVLDEIERLHEIPFGDLDPALPPSKAMLRRLGPPDEGDPISAEALADMQALVKASLTEDQAATLTRWYNEANKAGKPATLSAKPTARRHRLLSALILLARWDTDDESARLALAIARFEPVADQDVPVGKLIGELTIAEADALHDAVLKLEAGAAIGFEVDQRVVLKDSSDE